MKNYPEIFEINTDKNSKIANGAEDFHSDVSCDKEPPLGTMLQLLLFQNVVEIRCLQICIWPMKL